MDPVVVYVPRCVQNGSENLGLKALEDFDVGIENQELKKKFKVDRLLSFLRRSLIKCSLSCQSSKTNWDVT
jgi:hypothetical protein